MEKEARKKQRDGFNFAGKRKELWQGEDVRPLSPRKEGLDSSTRFKSMIRKKCLKRD